MKEEPKYFTPLKGMGEYLVHILVGTILFATIALFAMGIGELIEYLIPSNIDDYVRISIMSLKYLIFAADLILYIVFFISASVSLTKRILNTHEGSEK